MVSQELNLFYFVFRRWMLCVLLGAYWNFQRKPFKCLVTLSVSYAGKEIAFFVSNVNVMMQFNFVFEAVTLD